MDAYLLPLATAFCGCVTVYLLALRVRLPFGSRPAQALAAYVGEAEESRQEAADPRISREQVICAALGLPARPGTLVLVRLCAGLLPALALLLLGYPLVPALGAGTLTALLVHGWLEGRWRRFRLDLERELPTFVSRLASTLLVTGAPLAALEEVLATLPGDSPLRTWLERLAAGLRTQGQSHMEQARAEAATLSPSLALVVFELGRFFETGGTGFVQAFATTADELTTILEARSVAGAKADAARGAVHMMLGILGGIMLLMLSSPVQRQGFAHPTAQLVSAAALLVMGGGYVVLQGMIEDATG
jgi:hypothetical protein